MSDRWSGISKDVARFAGLPIDRHTKKCVFACPAETFHDIDVWFGYPSPSGNQIRPIVNNETYFLLSEKDQEKFDNVTTGANRRGLKYELNRGCLSKWPSKLSELPSDCPDYAFHDVCGQLTADIADFYRHTAFWYANNAEIAITHSVDGRNVNKYLRQFNGLSTDVIYKIKQLNNMNGGQIIRGKNVEPQIYMTINCIMTQFVHRQPIITNFYYYNDTTPMIMVRIALNKWR